MFQGQDPLAGMTCQKNHHKQYERGAQISILQSQKPVSSICKSEIPLRLKIKSNNSSRRDIIVRVNMRTVKAVITSLCVCRYISWREIILDLELSSIWISTISVKAST
jgi:hypothetical protein